MISVLNSKVVLVLDGSSPQPLSSTPVNDAPIRNEGNRCLLSGHQSQKILIDNSKSTPSTFQFKVSLEHLETYGGKKKESEAGSTGHGSDGQNVMIYDLHRLEALALLTHNRGMVIAVGGE